jgi:hypothetical protein
LETLLLEVRISPIDSDAFARKALDEHYDDEERDDMTGRYMKMQGMRLDPAHFDGKRSRREDNVSLQKEFVRLLRWLSRTPPHLASEFA